MIRHHSRSPRGLSLALLFALSLILGGLVFILPQTEPAAAAPPRQQPPGRISLLRGESLWAQNCAPCHGATGRGDGPTAASIAGQLPNFTDPQAARSRTLPAMYDVIWNGRMENMMPPWKNRLTEQQAWDLAAYAQSLSVTLAELDAGKTVYEQACAECHGPTGQAEIIDLTRPAALIAASPQSLFDALRPAEGDHAALAELSDDALWQSLAYVQTLNWDMPATDGILRGQVRNGTSGDPAGEITVTLHALSPSGEALQEYTTLADENGAFVFEELRTGPSVVYALEGTYEGVSYTSQDGINFVSPEKEIDAELLVYETSTEDPGVVQTRMHRIIAFGEGQITVADIHFFANQSDRTYIGQPAADGLPETVRIGLPPEATNISFQNTTVRPAGDGSSYSLAEPIIPGEETLVSVTYSIPIAGNRMSLETPVSYDIPSINVLVADQGETVDSDQLEFQSVQTFQGTDYRYLAGQGLSAGQPLVMEFSGLNQFQMTAGGQTVAGKISDTTQAVLLWSLVGVGGLALVFSLIYSGRTQPAVSPRATLDREKERLLLMLAELERLHQAGEIDEQAYQQIRLRNRNQLKQVLSRLQEQPT